MANMRVKDLIEILRTVDPNLPVHRRGSAGDYEPVNLNTAGYWLRYEELMQSKNDPSYYGRVNDPTWKTHKDQFREPFKAVVFD